MAGRTFAVYTLGCKVNQYETEAVAALFKERGYVQIPFEEKADLYVINTCSVTGESDRKNRQIIRRAHRTNPEALIAVMGCYSQMAENEVLNMEGVGIVVGTAGRSALPEKADAWFQEGKQSAEIERNIIKNAEFEHLTIHDMREHHRAFVKIQDGCDRFCTYCIIPYARGAIRSRDTESILQEVKGLAAAGYKEIVLTGIHLASYGKDWNGKISFIDVIDLASSVEGIERVRLGSLEPVVMDDSSVRRLAENKKLCRHFHIALQSGCDRILEKMKRRYTIAEFLDIICKIRSYMPDASFTTDVMVGFPGESEQDFEESLCFVKRIGFSKIHVFPFSGRKGTVAFRMPDQIPEQIKKERAKRMGTVAAESEQMFLNALVGTEQNVLFETYDSSCSEAAFTGHAENYVKVVLPETMELSLYTEEDIVNHIYPVKIIGVGDQFCIGSLY